MWMFCHRAMTPTHSSDVYEAPVGLVYLLGLVHRTGVISLNQVLVKFTDIKVCRVSLCTLCS